jgi:acetoin utilization deacetylase AcuC-like enzyme
LVPPLFHHASSLGHETGPGHPERPDRIRAIEAKLEARNWLGWEPREAPAATEDQLLAVHPPEYVERVREMSSRSAAFDADTPTAPDTWEAALRAAGGACAVVEALLRDGERAAFCATRPPGHHAEPARAMGFCMFSNAAIAARHAMDSLGARRVFVLDWDVHHGNGTNAIFHDSGDVLFASIHQFPFWPGTGALDDVGSGAGEGFSFNLPVPAGTGEPAFLSLLEHVVAPAVRTHEPDLILISAGYDAHRDDPLGGLALETASFGALARQVRALGEHVGAPVGALLEGGYDLRALAGSVAETMTALGGEGDPPAAVERHPLADRAAAVLGRYWDL